MAAVKSEVQTHVDPLLLEVADVVNTTLDLDTTLRRVAELVRKVIDYEIFGILLLNEKNCTSVSASVISAKWPSACASSWAKA